MKYEIVPATLDHAEELALTMRRADVTELEAMGFAPLPALLKSMEVSREAFSGTVDGQVACMFGVSSRTLLSSEAVPWLLASDEMPRHAPMFLRLNRAYVAKLRRDYRWLHNYVSPDNVVAIRWLRWLGFDVSASPTKAGPKGTMMLHFEMKTNV